MVAVLDPVDPLKGVTDFSAIGNFHFRFAGIDFLGEGKFDNSRGVNLFIGCRNDSAVSQGQFSRTYGHILAMHPHKVCGHIKGQINGNDTIKFSLNRNYFQIKLIMAWANTVGHLPFGYFSGIACLFCITFPATGGEQDSHENGPNHFMNFKHILFPKLN